MRLIDADAVKEYILNKGFYCDTEADKQYSAELVDKIFPTIKAVPLEDYRSMEQTVHKLTQALAEAEPKHGRWEKYGAITRGTLVIPIYRCSECKEDTNNWFWHYCPHCGTKMDNTPTKKVDIPTENTNRPTNEVGK